jgi:hypothetical protein
MSIVTVNDKVKDKDLKKASEEYGQYIKIVVDIDSGLIAIGGMWHADAEKILLKNGSRQENLWGGGIDMESKQIDYTALINIRPRQDNPSMEITDKDIRKRFLEIVKQKFKYE